MDKPQCPQSKTELEVERVTAHWLTLFVRLVVQTVLSCPACGHTEMQTQRINTVDSRTEDRSEVR